MQATTPAPSAATGRVPGPGVGDGDADQPKQSPRPAPATDRTRQGLGGTQTTGTPPTDSAGDTQVHGDTGTSATEPPPPHPRVAARRGAGPAPSKAPVECAAEPIKVAQPVDALHAASQTVGGTEAGGAGEGEGEGTGSTVPDDAGTDASGTPADAGAGANSRTPFLPFGKALAVARSLGLAGASSGEWHAQTEWRAWRQNETRPPNIPSNPERVYKNDGWKGWGHWLRGAGELGELGGGDASNVRPRRAAAAAVAAGAGVLESDKGGNGGTQDRAPATGPGVRGAARSSGDGGAAGEAGDGGGGRTVGRAKGGVKGDGGGGGGGGPAAVAFNDDDYHSTPTSIQVLDVDGESWRQACVYVHKAGGNAVLWYVEQKGPPLRERG